MENVTSQLKALPKKHVMDIGLDAVKRPSGSLINFKPNYFCDFK
jgi:hypothetical protein